MTELWSYLEQSVQLYALNIVIAIVILIIGRWIAKAVVGMLGRVMNKRAVDQTLNRFVSNMLFAFLMAVVIIAAIGQLGVQTTSLVAIVGAAGLAIGLALQGSLSNFAAGVMIIIFRPFRAGDYVEAGGVSGSVLEVAIFNTTLKTPDNKRVIVPNAQITGSSITNYSAEDKRRVDMVFGIGYGDDIRKAKEAIEAVLAEDERILKDPAPTIGVIELGASSVNLAVRPWVATADYWDVYFALNERMKLRFDADGLTIPFPQRDLHMYQH
ncbi:MAG: mechanosensitive ion channel [Bacteroidetes bacterium]|nr:mechanosensitive ion channel [Bacteroidota bacterium]